VITRDNVSVKVNAVVYFRVVDAQHAIIQVVNFLEATSQLAQTTLRAVLASTSSTSCCPSARGSISTSRLSSTRKPTPGHQVSNVEIKHVDLNETMVRAIARQAKPSASGAPR